MLEIIVARLYSATSLASAMLIMPRRHATMPFTVFTIFIRVALLLRVTCLPALRELRAFDYHMRVSTFRALR